MFSGGKDAAGKDTETVEETTTTTVTEAVTEPSATPSPAVTEPETTPSEDISPAEPSLAVDTDYVRLIDGVTPEMIKRLELVLSSRDKDALTKETSHVTSWIYDVIKRIGKEKEHA